MNKTKTQNPIIVFAALGVYLGLMLAGATPQVLAQAAMTRQFDVKDEIEVKDDLDRKPNSEECSEADAESRDLCDPFIEQWVRSAARYVDAFSYANSKGYEISMSLVSDGFSDVGDLSFPCIDKSLLSGNEIVRNDDNGYFRSLSLKNKPGHGNILSVFERYTSYLHSLVSSKRTPLEKLLIENTEISFKNDQILVVTRLPRGSLDALLAANAQ